jgi:uncharacterized protein YxjI
MNILKNWKYIAAYSTTFIVLLFGVLALLPKSDRFKITSQTPANKASGVRTKDAIKITFSFILDTSSPYESLTISPRVEGNAVVDGNTLIYTPTVQFRSSTTYTVTLKNALAATGANIKEHKFSFTTGEQALSDFEKKLPLTAEGYTIDRLSSGQIVVIISSTDAQKARAAAIEVLKQNNIDPKTVLFQLTSGARG